MAIKIHVFFCCGLVGCDATTVDNIWEVCTSHSAVTEDRVYRGCTPCSLVNRHRRFERLHFLNFQCQAALPSFIRLRNGVTTMRTECSTGDFIVVRKDLV